MAATRQDRGKPQLLEENDIFSTQLGRWSCSHGWPSCHGLMSATLAWAVTIFPRAKKSQKNHWISWHCPFKLNFMSWHACSQAPTHIAFAPKTHKLFWLTTMLSLVNGVQILLSQSNFNRRSHLTSCHTPSMHRGRSPGEVGKQQNRAEVYATGREVLATIKVSFDSESWIRTPFTTDRDLQLSRKSIYPANERPWFMSRQVSCSLLICLVIPHASLSFKYFCFGFSCDMSGLAFADVVIFDPVQCNAREFCLFRISENLGSYDGGNVHLLPGNYELKVNVRPSMFVRTGTKSSLHGALWSSIDSEWWRKQVHHPRTVLKRSES